MARLVVLLGGLALLAGCASPPEPERDGEADGPAVDQGLSETPEALVGDWRITGFITPRGAYHAVDEAEFTITFRDELDAVGSAACNDFNANIQFVDDEVLNIGGVGITNEPCGIRDPDLQAFEERFMINLTRRMEWSRSSDTLTLHFRDGGEWELTRL